MIFNIENWLLMKVRFRHFWQPMWTYVKVKSEVYFFNFCLLKSSLETVQDFLIKLDIKPLMHLLKISIFSINNDILRLTKIMNNLVKDCKIRTFKVIFQCLKLVESFRKKNSMTNIWLNRRPTFSKKWYFVA